MPIPYYYKSIDFEALVREYPPPEEFVDGVFRWGRRELDELQNRRFLDIVAYGWTNPFYRRKWEAGGVKPGDITSKDDIAKLPMVAVEDFKDGIKARPPFGEHQGLSTSDAVRTPIKIQSSGGTTGVPRPTLFTPWEWEMQGIQGARAMYVQGARPGDVMQIPSTLSTSNLGWFYYLSCLHWSGVVPITTGSGNVTPSRRQLEVAFEWGTNLWAGFPEYLMHLASVAGQEGFDLEKLPTKLITTFLGPDHDGSLRRLMETTWHCPVYDNYGTHEVGLGAFECREQSGLHVIEDMFILEVADVDTDQILPTGEKGNLVITSFYRRHPPLIRYNLRDYVRLVSDGRERCGCGSYFKKMDHFLGRSDDMVKLRGTNVFPMACLGAVTSDDRTTGEWLCIVDRKTSGLDIRDEMTVQVECKPGMAGRDELKRKLETRLNSDLGVKVTVELVASGSLAAYTYGREGKARRLVDKRFAKSVG
jgi:phenylacetate-CoA ligase